MPQEMYWTVKNVNRRDGDAALFCWTLHVGRDMAAGMRGEGQKPGSTEAGAARGRPPRRADPDQVRRDILTVARAEFAENGLSGARINEIAARTATSKRMIYYYFTDKEGLYLAVLEDAYARIRALEKTLRLEHLPPRDVLAALAGFTFDYHADNPDFVRLVMVENIHHARHLKRLSTLGEINTSAIAIVRGLYERGVADGAFRPGLDPIDIHLTLSALSFYHVSNRASVAQVFARDNADPAPRARRRASVIDAVLRFVASDG
jgi:AcrR family transcriptional regulator